MNINLNPVRLEAMSELAQIIKLHEHDAERKIYEPIIRNCIKMIDEVERLLLREKESKTALSEAMFSADSAEARMEDLVHEVERLKHSEIVWRDNFHALEGETETKCKTLLVVAKRKHRDLCFAVSCELCEAIDACD